MTSEPSFNLCYTIKKANYEGVINVKNDSKLVYWVFGASAACEINKVLTNKQYDGEYEFNTNYTQTQLEKAIREMENLYFKQSSR